VRIKPPTAIEAVLILLIVVAMFLIGYSILEWDDLVARMFARVEYP
jgi:hypothetical protein